MLKRIFKATRISVVALLVAAIFTPIQVELASASGTITKTITALGDDGQPYSGAQVAVVYTSQAGSLSRTSYSTIGVTDSDGVAQVTFPNTAIQGQIYAEPRLGDTTTASLTDYSDDHTNPSNVTIQFAAANIAVNILAIDGTNAVPNGAIWGDDTGYLMTFRTGAFGLAINPEPVVDECHVLQPIPADGTSNSLSSNYATKTTGNGSARVTKVYSDFSTCNIEAPKVNGVYQLQLQRGNISGTLLSNSGQPLSFSSSQGFEVTTFKLNDDGTQDQEYWSSWNIAPNDSTWSTFIDTSTPGKYEIVFTGYGNLNFPVFGEKYVWVTAGHKLSWSADGSNPVDSLTQNINIPVPNVKFSFVDPITALAKTARYSVEKSINGVFTSYMYAGSANGQVSFKFSDGTYKLNAKDMKTRWDQPGLEYTITVSGNSVTVTDSSNETKSPSNGIYQISNPPSNAFFSFVDEAGNPVKASADFCPENAQCTVHVDGGNDGLADFIIPNGSYPNTFVNPGSNENLTQQRYSATVTNGTLSIAGLTPVDGLYTFVIPTANIKFSVTNPMSGAPITQGWIGIETADSSWNGNGGYGNADINNQTPGRARAKLPDGRYLVTVNVQETDPSNAGLAGKTYQVTVTGGVPSLTYNGTPVNLVNGRFPVTPSASNLDLTVQDLSGAPLTDGQVDYCQDLGNGQTGSCRGFGLGNNGQASLSLANGSWILNVRPGSTITNMAARSYSVTVTNGVATIAGLTKDVSNRWIVTGTRPNVTGSFSLSAGSLSFTGNQGISLNLQKYNYGNWEWQNVGSWVRSINFAVNVTTQGRYRLVASPQNFADLVQSYSAEFWVNGSARVSKTEGGTYTDSITALTLLLKSPNLKLKVVNPLDNTLLRGGWVTIEKIDGQSRYWVSNADIQNSNPGLAGANLAEVGQYLLTVNPPNGGNAIVGLASRQYQLTVGANDSMTVTLDGVPVTTENNRFILSPASANITARIVKSDGSAFGNSQGKWVNINLQKFNSNNNWDWGMQGTADQDGYISMRVNDAGTYRLRIEPNGDADATVTYSNEFTVSSDELSTFKKEFGSITLAGPSIRVSVATVGNSATALLNAGIEIRKDGNWIDWANTGRNGVAGISLKAEGIYDFVVNPPGDLQGSSARKSYKVTAVKNSDGAIIATVNSGSGVSVSNGVTTLLLGTPTLTGTVLAPNGTTSFQSNSQVYAYNITTGQEMWDYATNSNSSGVWAMSLPAGTYKIFAKTPWGTSTYGASDGVGNVVVDSSGTATSVPNEVTSSAFIIRLKAPTWSGVVKNPAGAAVPNARVCLRLNNVFTCVNADNDGRWALSAPTGFTNFTGTNPYLEINDDFGRQYPQKRFDGVAAVNAAIGTSGTDIQLQFASANTQITVMAGGLPVSNVWVTAERDGTGWLGGGTTNASGIAKLDITDPTLEFKVRVELQGNPLISSSYATTMKTFSASDITNGTTASVFNGTVTLAEPNFKVVLREPTSGGSVGNAIPYSWIELYNDTTGMWIGGAGTDANGFASFKLDVPQSGLNNFTVNVNPSWNASTNFSRQAYAVAVSPTAVTVINKTTTGAVLTQSVSGRSVYPLTLGTPSVTGVVVDPNGNAIANSWVVPIDAVTNEYFWQLGNNSRNNGSIGLNLINGSYKIEANVPWGTSDVAKSAQCSVTVAGGTITTGGSCVQDGATKTVRLALRAPNLTLTLKVGGVAVANANVGIGSGKWYTNAQSDADGKVSLFVDADAIRSLNSYTTAQPLNVWVDPPYGGSVEMARWDCRSTDAKPICSGLVNVPATGDYPTTALGNVTGLSPNTRIHIVAPGTSTALPNSWVTVLAFDPAHPENKRWLGGANSNGNGYASMNLETVTALSGLTGWKFAVEINAPWNQRQSYATNMDTNSGNGYSWSEITNLPNKSPATPNLTVTVNTSNAIANKFGWIGVEEVNGLNIPQSWIGGYGLNENAISSVFLPASKRYRITAYPGPGKAGARTVCIVSTNSSAIVSEVSGRCDAGTFTTGAVTIALDGGNVVGLVTKASDGTPLAGAIVYANTSDSVDESTAVITSTGTDGRYGLQLDPAKTWNIKVFPTGTGSESLSTRSRTGITPPSSSSDTYNFSIVAA